MMDDDGLVRIDAEADQVRRGGVSGVGIGTLAAFDPLFAGTMLDLLGTMPGPAPRPQKKPSKSRRAKVKAARKAAQISRLKLK